jgi:membrane-bound lytic murein transglycosylase B
MSTVVSAEVPGSAAGELPDEATDDFDNAPRPGWRDGLLRLGAWVGAFGLVAVVLGVMSASAMQRTTASLAVPVVASREVADPPAGDGPAAGGDPVEDATAGDAAAEPAQQAQATQPTQRVDRAWAARNAAATGIPVRAFLAYASASLTLSREQPRCGIAWNTIAGIGAVESAHASHGGTRLLASGVTRPAIVGPALNGHGVGTIRDTDHGAWDGDRSWDHAVGPMQFIPSTWRRWASDGDGDGTANPNQIDDAALATARYLCASGPVTTPAGWRTAIYSYNHSDAYVNSVANAANQYAAAARP